MMQEDEVDKHKWEKKKLNWGNAEQLENWLEPRHRNIEPRGT